MTLNPVKFGFAWAVTFAVLWLFCNLFVWIMPSMMMNISGHMMHTDWSQMGGWHMPMGGMFIGLIGWSIVAGLIGGLIAFIYNKL